MEKERMLALSCCGESVEKVLTLYYHASQISSPEFYSQYRPVLFYGHNLPKRDWQSCAHGSVGFYQKFLSDIEFLPRTDMQFLWDHRRAVLAKLVYEGYLSGREADCLKAAPVRYQAFTANLPFEVIYPQYMEEMVCRAMEELEIYKLQPLYLEKNITKMILKINEHKDKYSIFALESNGTIGTFYLDYKDTNELVHWCAEMEKKSILSGNSALLLYQIGLRIGPQTIVGYRKRKKDKRPNREYALELLTSGRKTVLEPKNISFNQYYCGLDENLTDEQRGNIAFAKGYTVFLRNVVQNWNINPMKDKYIMEESCCADISYY